MPYIRIEGTASNGETDLFTIRLSTDWSKWREEIANHQKKYYGDRVTLKPPADNKMAIVKINARQRRHYMEVIKTVFLEDFEAGEPICSSYPESLGILGLKLSNQTHVEEVAARSIFEVCQCKDFEFDLFPNKELVRIQPRFSEEPDMNKSIMVLGNHDGLFYIALLSKE
jgi:hypothetical protein